MDLDKDMNDSDTKFVATSRRSSVRLGIGRCSGLPRKLNIFDSPMQWHEHRERCTRAKIGLYLLRSFTMKSGAIATRSLHGVRTCRYK